MSIVEETPIDACRLHLFMISSFTKTLNPPRKTILHLFESLREPCTVIGINAVDFLTQDDLYPWVEQKIL